MSHRLDQFIPRQRLNRLTFCLFVLTAMSVHVALAEPKQFILFNLHWNSQSDDFRQVSRELKPVPGASVQVGVSAIFSYLDPIRKGGGGAVKAFPPERLT